MGRTHGPELTFTVHPRPEREEPIGRTDPLPLPANLSVALPAPMPRGETRCRDTFFGDLLFLARFAFGRY